MIRNLLTNAVRYGGPNVKVAIEAGNGETGDDRAILAVIDDGPGVKSVDQERIFDPYYRSRPDVALTGSVGLGLSVERQLARLMGGDLVYIRRNEMTRFELTLPLDRLSHPLPIAKPAWRNTAPREGFALRSVPPNDKEPSTAEG